MKVETNLLQGSIPSFWKYLPSPEVRALILNYFKYNNFQDFNTWQQIARTKLEQEYQDKEKAFLCKLKLKWDDKNSS